MSRAATPSCDAAANTVDLAEPDVPVEAAHSNTSCQAAPDITPASPATTPESFATAPEIALERTPEATPVAAPDNTPEAPPEGTPEATPDIATEAAPETAPEVATETAPKSTSEIATQFVNRATEVLRFATHTPAPSRGATPLPTPTRETPPPSPRALRGDAERFCDVLHTCIRRAAPARPDAAAASVGPTCHNTLQNVTMDDLHAYRSMHPRDHTALEGRLADVLRSLYDRHAYRHVGLYISLLMQGIDLAREGYGPLTQGRAGVVSGRLAAMVRQSLEARDVRANAHASALPFWAIIVMTVLAALVLVTMCIVVWLLFFRT